MHARGSARFPVDRTPQESPQLSAPERHLMRGCLLWDSLLQPVLKQLNVSHLNQLDLNAVSKKFGEEKADVSAFGIDK